MRLALLLIFAILVVTARAEAATRKDYATDVCRLINQSATQAGLPVPFFTRLIWRESMFDDQALSPVGAQGIAQFMPGTARLRGLADAFDYRQALPASAEYLQVLRIKFGNLGLAAAAYNLGEDGTARWLAGKRSLPNETEDYVLEITGSPASTWRTTDAAADIPGLPGAGNFPDVCLKLVMRQAPPPSVAAKHRAPKKPWGVVLASGFSESRSLASFNRVKTRFAAVLKDELPMVVRKRNLSRGRKMLVSIMVGRDSRPEADKLCGKLQGAGAACFVARN